MENIVLYLAYIIMIIEKCGIIHITLNCILWIEFSHKTKYFPALVTISLPMRFFMLANFCGV